MRKSSEEADDDLVPEWPDEHVCKDCGRGVWIISNSDGDEVEIDSTPMETQVVNGAERIRGRLSARFDEARRESGWSIPTPIRVSDVNLVALEDDERDFAEKMTHHYEWFSTRVPLTVNDDQVLFSEHRLTCSAKTEKFLGAMLPEFGGEVWDEVEPIGDGKRAKRVHRALQIKHLVRHRPELILGWRMFRDADVLDDVTGKNGQLGLWWTPEMEKPRRAVQEVRQSQLTLFRGGQHGSK